MDTGSITIYAGNNSPSGFLLCDGRAIPRSDYSELFAVVSTIYGAGDGSTTFNLPDLRGRFPIGKAISGTASVLGEKGGTINHSHGGSTGVPSSTVLAVTAAGTAASATHTHPIAQDNPPYISLNFIIKT